MMASLLAHKRADLWGPDAEVFRPERWFEPALLDKVARTPFMYSPFYGGPRAVSTPHLPSRLTDSKKKILVFGTGIRAESSGLLHRAPITTIQLLQPRTRFHARGIVATLSLGRNARSSRCREDPPGDQLYDAQQGACGVVARGFFYFFSCFRSLMLRRRIPSLSGVSIYRVAFGYLPNPRLRRRRRRHLKFPLRLLLLKRPLLPRWRRPRLGELKRLLARGLVSYTCACHTMTDGFGPLFVLKRKAENERTKWRRKEAFAFWVPFFGL